VNLARGWTTAERYLYDSPVRVKVALSVGYLALTVAVAAAYLNPATGYELSIYAVSHTPIAFWVGVAVALVIGLLATLNPHPGPFRPLGFLLAGAGMLAVVGLPLIRGYYFYGLTDPLIHLGWTRAVAAGVLHPMAVLYPGGHLAAILVGEVAGFPYRHAMMLLVVAMAGIYFLFVPLAVRVLDADPLTVSVAAFSGLLLLPVNNVSTFLRFHAFSLTILFLPLALYLLLRHLLAGRRRFAGLGTPVGFTLFVASTAVLIFHPQAMLNLLVLFGAIAGYQFYRRRQSTRPENDLAPVYLHTLLLGGLFFLWISDHWQLYTTLEQTRAAILGLGGSSSVGQVVTQRGTSAVDIGAGLPEMFVKLFGVSAVYLTLAVVYIVNRHTEDDPRNRTAQADVYAYFLYGGLALLPLALINYLGQISTYFFRHVGFGMVLVTIVGAIAIRRYGAMAAATVGRRHFRPVVAVVLAVALVLSVAALFPSPFIYLPNHHVTEAQMNGYETAFNQQAPESPVWFGGVRTTTNRYESALIDAPFSVWTGPVPGTALSGDVREYYRTHEEEEVRRDHYLVVTRSDIQREVDAYQELRYTSAELEAVDANPGVHRIQTNGEFTLYYIDLEESAEG
jgi:hypothetical protein